MTNWHERSAVVGSSLEGTAGPPASHIHRGNLIVVLSTSHITIMGGAPQVERAKNVCNDWPHLPSALRSAGICLTRVERHEHHAVAVVIRKPIRRAGLTILLSLKGKVIKL